MEGKYCSECGESEMYDEGNHGWYECANCGHELSFIEMGNEDRRDR